MNRIHIVGRKGHGKTNLIVDLVEEFARSGIRVGTVKHSGHSHELDTPGKDSHRHRAAGANPVAVVTENLIAMYRLHEPGEEFYELLAPLFSDCRLVLVEGHVDAPDRKIEVWRAEVGGPCLAAARDDIAAVVTDDTIKIPVPAWPRRQITELARHVITLAESTF